MTHQEKQQLKALFVATSSYYGHEIPDTALRLYVEDLDDLPFAEIAQALLLLRRDPKQTKCPLPAVIRARINAASDPDSHAVMIAGRILEAIAMIGPYETAKARTFIGPHGWRAVEMSGGWHTICQSETDDLGVRMAQWRNLAKATLTMPDVESPMKRLVNVDSTEGLKPLVSTIKSRPDGAA